MVKRGWTLSLALWLGLTLVIAGCGAPNDARRFTGQFQPLELEEAPAQLQATYERRKEIPGLYVLEQRSETYLLVVAGQTEQPGLGLEVLEVRKPPGDSNEVRVLARLRPVAAAAEFPYVVLRLSRARGLKFTARVSTLSERVLDLPGQPVTVQ